MPHMSSGGSEDFYSTDEVKVYKDEGNKDEEKRSSENLSEEKLGLVTETEEGKNSSNYAGSKEGSGPRVDDDKTAGAPGPVPPQGSMGFFLPPYAPYPNGGGKFGMQPPYPGLVMYNDFTQPPPAHMGIPPVHTDPKTGLPRPSMYAAYPAPHSQFPHPLYGPDFPQVQWHRPAYPISGAFSGSYPPSISRYGPPSLLPHPGLPHPGMPHPGVLPGHKTDMMVTHGLQDSHRLVSHEGENGRCKTEEISKPEGERKRPYIKKPLNAFMLFMKEMRPKVISECTLRESSAINQILGRKWHALDRSEQAKYYEMARKEKDLHMQLYPGWSARDNYAAHNKKKKRKKEQVTPQENKGASSECPNAKKCRARYGLDQQSQWCKPCRRKKKCIRYEHGENGMSTDGEDCDDESSRLSSQRSGCDTDSNLDLDSPRPDHRTSYTDHHSPLSPLISENMDDELDPKVQLNAGLIGFSSSSAAASGVHKLSTTQHSLQPLEPVVKAALTTAPIKAECASPISRSSPNLVAT
ncbi:protein pangolin, isoforms A/H/I/S-like isoform X2 [Pomacea canaliculata]|uniref:protein pangolin, isoforms A/H/I/S-like isoform X2 n=1 Tax=Pomacea canaliculata TaxID=400727 RepID=UPI000D73D446|nr:protein pangolin, isoforms A/H/I/S-like isoform X2 [Pomacea canaliculata]